MFVLVLPIALGSLWLGWRRIENVTTPRDAPLDIASVVLSAFAFGGLVYGLELARRAAGAAVSRRRGLRSSLAASRWSCSCGGS